MAVKYSIEYNNFNCFSYCHLCWWKLEFKNFLPIRIRTHLDDRELIVCIKQQLMWITFPNEHSFFWKTVPKPVVANILIPGDCFIL